MPLCAMTACIFSMVTGRPPVRKLLYKPAKALALKQLQCREICSYFKPAVIQLPTSKKHDLKEKKKAVNAREIAFVIWFIDAFGRKGKTHF